MGSSASSRLSSLSSRARDTARKSMSKLAKLMKHEVSPIDIDACIVRKYAFRTDSREREVQLSHTQGIWFIMVDSRMVATKTHNNSAYKKFRTCVEFPIDL